MERNLEKAWETIKTSLSLLNFLHLIATTAQGYQLKTRPWPYMVNGLIIT